MMSRSQLLWLIFALLWLVGCSADRWETYRPVSGASFTIAIPEAAERQIPAEATLEAAGEPVGLELLNFRREGALYTVARGSLPEEAGSVQAVDAILDAGQRWLEQEHRFRDVESSALSWHGYPGRSLRFYPMTEEEEVLGRANILLVDRHLYLLVATGPQEIIEQRADRFLASFTAGAG